jgi:hypothetical protein
MAGSAAPDRLEEHAVTLSAGDEGAGAAAESGWRWLVAVMVAGLALCGAVTVARFHVWAPVDERAHYAYVQSLAEQGRLPRVEDLVSTQVQAITENSWPRPARTSPAQAGLAGRNYEAFQPPLYYLLAVPAFVAVPDHRDKVFALRAFDLVLVGVAAGLLWLLARRVLPEAPLVAFAGGLGVLLWPGVLVRAVTVSNAPLELVLVTATLAVLERAWSRRDGRWLVAAGVLTGACLLTKLTLLSVLVPLALVAWSLRREAALAALAAVVAPAVVLSPWLASNVVRLGTLTANGAALDQQQPFLYPTGDRPGLADLPGRLWQLSQGVLPQEWTAQLDVAWVRAVTLLLVAALAAGALAAAIQRRSPLGWMALAGVAGYLALATGALSLEHWDVFLLRYAAPLLPALGVSAAAWMWKRAGDRRTLVAATGGVLLTGALWADMAGRFYFTDLGHHLGI